MQTQRVIALATFAALSFALCARADAPRPAGVDTVEGRFPAPDGFARIADENGGFGSYLRRLPLRPGRPPVHLFDGREKANQAAHVAVVDIDVGDRDLQQCADAVMRLRAEYLRAAGRAAEVCFRTAGGDRLRFTGPPSSWRRYLDRVFAYANTASLARQLAKVDDPSRPEIGDVFVEPAKGGRYGHAVIVVDVAEDARGARRFLLAQSYMPAQEIHVLANPRDPASPWYAAAADGALDTPEWRFPPGSLRRFRPGGC
jgi:hypothetical protein